MSLERPFDRSEADPASIEAAEAALGAATEELAANLDNGFADEKVQDHETREKLLASWEKARAWAMRASIARMGPLFSDMTTAGHHHQVVEGAKHYVLDPERLMHIAEIAQDLVPDTLAAAVAISLLMLAFSRAMQLTRGFEPTTH